MERPQTPTKEQYHAHMMQSRVDTFQDRMVSIDEEELEEGQVQETPFVHAPSPVDIPTVNPAADSLRRWKGLGKVPLSSNQKLNAVAEDPEVFQSETTLIESKNTSQNELQQQPKEDIFTAFKSRIAKLLEKPMEKLYGRSSNTKRPSNAVPTTVVEQKPVPQDEPNVKKILSKKPSREITDHKKSASLLSKLSTKLHHMKPFNELAPLEEGKVKPAEAPKKETEEEEPGTGYANEAEYLKALRTRKLFESRYKILREVGAGGHSTVYIAEKLTDHSVVVCKFIKKSSVWRWYKDPYDGTKIPYEIHVLRQFRDEPKLKVIRYFEHYALGAGRFVIVMEYLGEDWCDLYDYVEKFGPVKEIHTRDIFSQVVDTIGRMHDLGYLHNDIKDENIMINMRTREIKLIDFGSCTPLVPGKRVKLFYGTKKFAAPEALQSETYDPECQEVWALGTLLYVLLFKMDPFKTDEDILETNVGQKIQRLRISGYNSFTPIDISDESVDAMLAMLAKDPAQRITLDEVKRLSFLAMD